MKSPRTVPAVIVWKIPDEIREARLDAGGIHFRYLESGPATGAARTVLLLHGFGARSEIWLEVMKELPREWQVVAVDLPCHGLSSQLPGKVRTVPLYLQALAAFVEAKMPPHFAIIGSSLGGALGAMLALKYPQRVDKLVLAAASGLTPKLPGKTVRLYLPYILGAYLFTPTAKKFRSFLAKGVFYDPKFIQEAWLSSLVEEWRPRAQRMSFLAIAGALRRPDASVSASLGNLKVPTLLLWGKNDAHFDWAQNEQAAKSIPGSRFVVYDNCGHLPMVEKFRESLAEVRGFLG